MKQRTASAAAGVAAVAATSALGFDWVLYAIVAAFVVWEAVAHFLLHNQSGHTLSDRIEWLETKGGWPVRVVVSAAVVALGVHLQGVF